MIEYHQATKHSPWSVRAEHVQLDWANQPLAFKIYTSVESMALPLAFKPSAVPPLSAIAGERADPPRPLDRELLARLCYFSNGITRVIKRAGRSMAFRAAACTGALYHLELYLVCGDLSDLGAGVYHYAAHDNSLRLLRPGDFRAVLVSATGAEPSVIQAPVSLVCTSTYWRNAWKYRARAYRHVFWDTGTIVANLLSVAAANGVTAGVVLGFADGDVNHLLGVDPAEEAAVCVVTLNASTSALPSRAVSTAAQGELTVPPLALPTQPLSASRVDYPQIIAAHAASSLASGEAAAAWRSAATPAAAGGAPNPPSGGQDFPQESPRARPHPVLGVKAANAAAASADKAATALAADPRASSIEAVILRRGSSRRFARTAIGAPQLFDMLLAATAPVASDFGAHGVLTKPYLIVNAVDGLAPGAYVFNRQTRSLELLKEGDFRREAAFLDLDQELAGDAAVNAYWLADLPAITGRLGQRGYRAAQLEAAIQGGKLYLAAYALGLGATGLTFYDDEVTRFFEPHASGKAVMFLVALGHSARREH